MAINTALLISAPMLQDYLVDKDTGLPLADGTITMYQDNSRTTLKNWYYQTGTPGNYTYITLPNPLTLSAVGTITDVNGNDTIPFYYPYSEIDNSTPQAYYVTVDSANGERQFTRQNFPFVSPTNNVINSVPSFSNLIINNVFWRNIGTLSLPKLTTDYNSIDIDAVTLYYITIAPSQHDGLTMPDIVYVKNVVDATETITFNKFTVDNALTNDVTPEYYLNLNTTGAGTEAVKYIQIPIQLHIQNFSGYTQASVSIWAQNVGGGANNTITLKIYQFAGTGGTTATASTLKTISATQDWIRYTADFTFPTSSLAALGLAGDDAWYLQIGFQPTLTTDINIAKPSVYLSQIQPNDEFQNYDVVESVINSPRTGDIRTSLNTFAPFGWVPLNDGTIGNASSNGTARADVDTWQLFNLIWNAFSAYTVSTTNPIAQMYNSSNVATAYGATAYADFSANNQLALTKTMGKVLLGTVPLADLLPASSTITGFESGVTFSSSSGTLLVTTTTSNLLGMFKGGVVTFAIGTAGVLPTGITANTLYYIVPQSSTTFFVSISFANALAGTYVVWTNNGTAPNNVYAFPAGSFEGEYAHLLLNSELPTSIGASNILMANGGGGTPVLISAENGAGVLNNAGGGNPSNITQPGTFYNMFMKL